ncbi:MAG: tRNA (guanosine(46)-N7)-methyltransferase TrmB [Caulobacteraceae bacterium]
MFADKTAPPSSFGRIRSRPIKPRQAALFDSLLPRIAVPDGPFDPCVRAPDAAEVWLEIGFGGGEHLAAQARARPDVLFIGAEPFVNGVASALRHVQEGALAHVCLHTGDARDLMARMPAACLDRIFVLFPDPWPKLRHHKRRLVNPAFVIEAARLLKVGGRVRFATDWADYADWTLERFLRSDAFRWVARTADDWRRPPVDHVATRYEQKRLGDCAPVWFDFARTVPAS